MSNILEQASLVLVPSGYKAGKVYSQIPIDGEGDLQFTRSNDTATRVNSAGLIEKVRTNLVRFSEQFDNAAWSKQISTITANATTAPDGTTTADKLVAEVGTGTSTQHRVDQNTTSAAGSNTFSVYAKKGEIDIIQLRIGISGASFDLTNGTVGVTIGGVTATILNVGNGWYRCFIVFTSVAANEIVRINLATTISVPSSFIGDNVSGAFIWGAQLETGDIATDYIPTTTAAVSVGMLANVPRLDYSGGGCPKLLLEPQRTNLVTYSEQFDNAVWTKTAVNVTANNAVSPDGYTNADKITETATTGIHRVFQNASVSAGNNTFSFFAKKDERSSIEIVFGGTAYPSNYAVLVNLDTQVVTGNTADITTSIVDFGNGWLRCSFTSSASSSASSDIQIYLRKDGVSRSYAGDGTSGLYLWGAQLE